MSSRRAATTLTLAAAALLAAAAAVADTPPPAAGTWHMSTDRTDFTGGQKPLHNFDGTFKVAGTTIEGFTGVERHVANQKGLAKQFCVTGEKVTVRKKLTIKHTTGGPVDTWDVPDQVVKVYLSNHGHKKTDTGEIQIHFLTAGIPMASGSSLALSTCHLQFDISGP